MSWIERNLKQCATHWATDPDGYGGYAFKVPRELACRWEVKNQLFRAPNGEEQVSQAIVYLDCDIAVGDYLMLGSTEEQDPTTFGVGVAFIVRQFNTSPDLRNLEKLRKAIL